MQGEIRLKLTKRKVLFLVLVNRICSIDGIEISHDHSNPFFLFHT